MALPENKARFPLSPIFHYANSSWIKKTFTKTIIIQRVLENGLVWSYTEIFPNIIKFEMWDKNIVPDS